MKFASPYWLIGIAVTLLYFMYLRFYRKSKKKEIELFVRSPLWGAVIPELDLKLPFFRSVFFTLGLTFLFFSLARPQWGTHEETMKLTGMDVMIALDVSQSMETEDMVPSRLKKAKRLIRRLSERLEGDRLGLIAFAASSWVASPLTTDHGYVLDIVEVLSPKSVTNQGTDISTALETAVRSLDRGAEVNSSGADLGQTTSTSRVLILLSDGEDHENEAMKMAEQLKEKGIALYVIGVGTEKGGPIPLRDPEGSLRGYKRDSEGKPVVSTFKPDFLKDLAAKASGKFWSASTTEGEVDELVQVLGGYSRGEFAEKKVVTLDDHFMIFLAFAIVFFVSELFVPARRRASSGVLSKAAGFLIVAIGVATGLSKPALAEGTKTPSVGAYYKNRDAIEALNEGKIDDAKKLLNGAQAESPDLSELDYNQGVVQSKEGNFNGALQSFSEATKKALESKDSRVAAHSLFNLGNVLSQNKKTPEAIQSYIKGIEEAKKAKDQTLENDLRKNLELLVQQQQKQDQQKDQDKQDKKDQDKKDQKEQDKKDQDKQDKKDQDKKDQKDQPEKDKDKDKGKDKDQGKDKQKGEEPDPDKEKDKEKDKNQQSQKKRDFQSQKLSKEDAERVMSELSNRERQLKSKLERQQGTSTKQEKDW